MKHLSRHEILEAMERPSYFADHLAQCGVCAGRLAALKETGSAYRAIGLSSDEGTEQCYSTEDLAEFLRGGGDKVAVKTHLAQCDACFESAAYYFAESTRLALAPEVEVPEKFRRAALAIVPAQSWWKQWVVAPLPAYATALALWLILLYTPGTPKVVLLNETAFFSIYEKKFDTMPYFYFSGGGKKVGSQLSGMRVATRRGEVVLQWNPVQGVDSYYVLVQEMVNGAPTKMKEIKTISPTVTLSSDEFRPGASYRWIAAGSMGDNRYFQGKAEFRIAAN